MSKKAPLQEGMQAILEDAIRRQVTPGVAASILIADGWRNSIDFFAGKLEPNSSRNVGENTSYDLASLTKVLSTTLLCAVALDLGKIGLDEKPWALWPGVSVAHVLNHTSGLASWLPLYKEAVEHNIQATRKGEKMIVRAALASKPIALAGKEFLYSDIGYIALGALLQERLNERLDILLHDVSRRYWDGQTLAYHCLYDHKFQFSPEDVASTGENPWFKKVFCGQVHDPNCYAMGGIAGHAGLFGDLTELKKAAAFLLSALKGTTLGVCAVLRDFANWAQVHPLGFDKPTPGGSTDNYLSPASVGHLGFTGTSLWIDPLAANGKGTAYILLSNRVFFGIESNEAITELRRAFHRIASQVVQQTSEVKFAEGD